MDKSGTYAACEQFLQMSYMVMQISQVDEILQRLEGSGRLTSNERERLLQFARDLWGIEQ